MRLRTMALIAAMTTLPAPAFAQDAPRTRLISCGTESCLLVEGFRETRDADVLINGHQIAAQGEQVWRVVIPVQTVRQWSEPYARTITVAVTGNNVVESEARLPIGLLGQAEQLASLVVRVKY